MGFELLTIAPLPVLPAWAPALSRDRMSWDDLLHLRTLAQLMTRHPEISTCGKMIRKRKRGTPGEILEILKTCKHRWLCPTCSAVRSREQARRTRRRLAAWAAKGGALAFLTLTQHHTRQDGLDAQWDVHEAGWAALKRDRPWRADSKQYGLEGYIRSVEVVYGSHGWHVHSHVLLLLARSLDDSELADVKAALGERFIAGVRAAGGQALLGCQDLNRVTSGQERVYANYNAKGMTAARSKDGSLTPIGLLRDIVAGLSDRDLWFEYTHAVTARKRVQFSSSNGIDALCGLTSVGDAATEQPTSGVGAEGSSDRTPTLIEDHLGIRSHTIGYLSVMPAKGKAIESPLRRPRRPQINDPPNRNGRGIGKSYP